MPFVVTNTLLFLLFLVFFKLGFPVPDVANASTPPTLSELLRGLLRPHLSFVLIYWFLPTIFFVTFIARAALDFARREWILVALMAVSLPFFLLGWDDLYCATSDLLNWNGVLAFLFWWGAGYFYCKYQRTVEHVLRLDSGWTCLALLSVLVGAKILCPQAYMLNAVAGILLCISAGLNYVKHDLRLLNHLYGYSFPIYLLHWAVFVVFNNWIPVLPWWFLMPLAAVCGIYIPILVAKFVQRFLPGARLLRLLVGGRRRSE